MASTVSARPTSQRGNSKTDALRELSKGLKIEAEFCPTDVADPFDTVQWDLRSAQIKDENGKLMFEQKDAEIPAAWTQLATNVVVSKYFYGETAHLSANGASASSFTASRGQSPTGARPTAILPTMRTPSNSIAS